MFSSDSLLFLVLVALSVDAGLLSRQTGKATLRFTRRINELHGGSTIADMDRARAQAMKNTKQLGKRQQSIGATNADVTYTAQVGVGDGTYALLIDTGSSNTWVGANPNNPYKPGPNSKDTGESCSVVYGSGSVSGVEWIDTVTLSPSLVITAQSICVASDSSGFGGVDGILGVGPTDLTIGTVNNGDQAVPTIMDNLYLQGTIAEEVLGVYYVPASVTNIPGELTFGGYAGSVINGTVNYVPLTATSPASYYWGIDQSVVYGETTILATTAGIVDTGTTLILIASDAFAEYQSLTGSTLDQSTGLLTVSQAQYNGLQSLSFNIGGTTYELTPDGQIWPRSLNTYIGGSADAIYLIVNDIGSPSGSGLDFIDGYTFLERYYSVFDTTNDRVGFAPTGYTYSESN